MTTITIPELNDGESWAGIAMNENGTPSHHVILLPGENYDANWESAKDWAESIGGVLPSRQEQSLLYANLKNQFKEDRYWSGEQHASDSDYAWFQTFNNGYQGINVTRNECRARAVRRFPI